MCRGSGDRSGRRNAVLAAPACPDANVAAFGPNVCVFSDTMSQAAIQADLNAIATQQVPVGSQFDSNRYSVFFEPGTYGSAADPLVFQVGYYTQVAGLGAQPSQNGDQRRDRRVQQPLPPATSDCNADDNFWRSLSNLTLNVDLPTTPPAYAPPAGRPVRRRAATTAPRCGRHPRPTRSAAPSSTAASCSRTTARTNNFASGGFIADSQISGDLNFFGNQQYMVRNSSIGGVERMPDGLWNMVYSGVEGAPAAGRSAGRASRTRCSPPAR